VRSSTSDATVTLKAPRRMSLDECLEFISEDELVEITPESIRLRKKELDENKRASMKKKLKSEQ
jgi:GTP-binding protein